MLPRSHSVFIQQPRAAGTILCIKSDLICLQWLHPHDPLQSDYTVDRFSNARARSLARTLAAPSRYCCWQSVYRSLLKKAITLFPRSIRALLLTITKRARVTLAMCLPLDICHLWRVVTSQRFKSNLSRQRQKRRRTPSVVHYCTRNERISIAVAIWNGADTSAIFTFNRFIRL